MKEFSYIFLSCLCGVIFGLIFVHAANNDSTRERYQGDNLTPDEILDDIVGKAKGNQRSKSEIIVTKLDGTTNTKIFDSDKSYKLSGTLESVRMNISFYLQWVAYIALSSAVLLIIYNGARLVLSPVEPDEASKIKTRMIYIALGIILVTGFYFVLKILLSVYYQIFVA